MRGAIVAALQVRFNGAMKFIAAAMILALSAHTARADALIDGAKQCTQYFPVNEQHYRIPVHLLAAIASAESGRWHEGLGMPLPWPWTINAAGKGYYFNSKAEAIAKAQSLMAQGIKSMDVGCMQVNLKHHHKAFANLNEAFDPLTNVAYAAKFLRTNYDDLGDWVRAAAAYHSRTPNLGSKYLKRIEVTWNRIVERVRMAQAKNGTITAADIPPENPMTMKVTAPGNTAKPIPSARGVKVLQVNDASALMPPVEAGITPEAALAPAAGQVAAPPSLLVVRPDPTKALSARAFVASVNTASRTRDDMLVAGAPLKDPALGALPSRGLDNAQPRAQKKMTQQFVFAY